MIENFETIKQNVLTLTGLEDSPKFDLQIQMLIDECLAYCYRDDVPPQMELPLSDVIATEINKRQTIGIEGDVSSYKEGDMQVTFGSVNTLIGKGYYSGKLEPFKQIIGVIKDVQK